MALRLVSAREEARSERQSSARAMVSGTMCYVAGATGFDHRHGQMPRSLEQQTRNALADAQEALERSGFSLDDVIRINYALVHEDDLARVVQVGDFWFGGDAPDMTYEVAWPRQAGQRICVEIMAQKYGD